MRYFIMFTPWIAYAIMVDTTSWTTALVTSAALAFAFAAYDLVTTKRVDYLTTGGVVFFVGFLVAAELGAPDSVRDATQIASHGWIAALMWLSIFAGRPFTTTSAEQEAPREAWDMPFFKKMNLQVSSVWAGCFTVATIAMIVVKPLDIVWLIPSIQGASITLSIILMQPFIAAAQREGDRLEAAANTDQFAGGPQAMGPAAAA